MAAAVGAASLDGVVHADAVVVPRRLPRQGGSEPEILEGICGSSAGVAAAGEVPGLPRCIGGVAVDAGVEIPSVDYVTSVPGEKGG